MKLRVGLIIHVRRPDIDSECIAAIVTRVESDISKITKFPPTGGSTSHMTTRGHILNDNENVTWHDRDTCDF